MFFASFVYFFSSSGFVEALTYSDDFTIVKPEWVIGQNQPYSPNIWRVESGRLLSLTNNGESSFYYVNDGGWGNFVGKAKIENRSGVDLLFVFHLSTSLDDYYQVDFRYRDPYWPQDGGNIRLWKFVDNSYSFLAKHDVQPDNPLNQGLSYDVMFGFSDGNITVYLSGEKVIDVVDSLPLPAGYVGLKSWAGDYPRTVENYFDDFEVSNFESDHKTVILPGLGGSWNTEALVHDTQVADGDWKMTPFVKIYDPLIDAFEDQGLVQNQDFWVWNYDWRLSVSDIGQKLGQFIDTNVGSSEKIDLVGHSLGGLVAREWAVDHQTDARRGDVISLGSPYLGSVKAYDAWAGGKFGKDTELGNVAMNLLLTLKEPNPLLRKDHIRSGFPVFGDILPVWNFLYKNGSLLPSSKWESQNGYLPVVNLVGLDEWHQLAGTGFATAKDVYLGEATVVDKIMGFWPDGRPTRYSTVDGDQAVTWSSGSFGGVGDAVSMSNHGQLPVKSIGKVVELLGLDQAKIGPVSEVVEDELVVAVASPIVAWVNCGGGVVETDSDGLAVVSSPSGNCQIGILGTGEGEYRLAIGRIGGSNSWWGWSGNLMVGETRSLEISAETGELVNSAGNVDFLYQLLMEKANVLADSSLTAAVSSRNRSGIWKLLLDRCKQTPKNGTVVEMMDIMVKIELMVNSGATKSQADMAWYRMIKQKSYVDQITRLKSRLKQNPSLSGAENYALAETEYDEAARQKSMGNYAGVVAREAKVVGLWQRVW